MTELLSKESETKNKSIGDLFFLTGDPCQGTRGTGRGNATLAGAERVKGTGGLLEMVDVNGCNILEIQHEIQQQCASWPIFVGSSRVDLQISWPAWVGINWDHLLPPRWWRRALWRVTFRLSSCTEWKSRSFDWNQCFDCRKKHTVPLMNHEIESVYRQKDDHLVKQRDRSQQIWQYGWAIFLFGWLKE